MPEHRLDVKGLRCPMPVLRARRKLSEMAPGEALRIEATDPQAAKDFPLFCAATGHRLLESTAFADHWVFRIERRAEEPGS
jgi:tRNA 2-thiouridine synthesizing protein A